MYYQVLASWKPKHGIGSGLENLSVNLGAVFFRCFKAEDAAL